MSTVVLPILLSACSAPLTPAEEPALEWVVPGEEPAPEAAAEEPSPYTYPGEAPDPVGAYDEAAVSDALQQAIDGIFAFRGKPGLDAYLAAMNAARPSCPTTYGDSADTSFWMDTCSTSDGATFEGYATYAAYDAHPMGSSTWDGDVMWGNASIRTALGYVFEGGGTLYDLRGEGEVEGKATESWYSVISGIYSWDGPGDAGTWLESAVTPSVRVLFTRVVEIDGHRAEVSGSVPLDDPAFGSATFSEVVIASESVGWNCASEPSGSVSLRDAEGYWYDVSFHGSNEVVEEALCDGCGTVSFRGEVVGQACVDWSPWVDWGSAPW